MCTASSDTGCSACDPSCGTCTGPGPEDCVSLCGTAPDPLCLVATQAQLLANEKMVGKERLKLRWKKVASATTRADFGDPVAGSTIAVACVFDDADTLVAELVVDRAGDICGTKPCWKTSGTEGLAYKDKAAAASGVVKLIYRGAPAGKGKAIVLGKNDVDKGLTSLPTGVAAALAGETAPTIELVTSDGLCIGAKMNKIAKDTGLLYKALKK
jgi:hypothetical protein